MQSRGFFHRLRLNGLLMYTALVAVSQPTWGQTSTLVPEDKAPVALFSDFLHFARIGRFTEAKAYADKLLAISDLDPTTLVAYADKDRDAVPTLLTLIRHSSLSDTAQKLLDLLREGEFKQREEKSRIESNIEKLGGPPQLEFNAIQRLKESGEYAIPDLIAALLDPTQSRLHPRILRALPQIGRPAVGPLVQALQTDNQEVRRYIITALGEIGYPQAAPYLLDLLRDNAIPAATKVVIDEALARIAGTSDRPVAASAPGAYVDLGERFYEEHASVQADPRLDKANVWYWENGALVARQVPTPIFGSVMAMRTAERALELQPDNHEAIALWVAADFRREGRLGLNVESADAPSDPAADPTRPENFPRSIYFARAAGPEYNHRVLTRAVRDGDKQVALGAIAALDAVAGEGALLGPEDYKQALVQALRFPDAEVRIKAAIALARALPQGKFAGADLVGPALAEALRQGSAQQYVVAVRNADTGNRIAGELRELGAKVVVDTGFLSAMSRARTELPATTAFVLGSDLEAPSLATAMDSLRAENLYARTPVVVLNVPGSDFRNDDARLKGTYVRVTDPTAKADAIRGLAEEAAKATGAAPVGEEASTALALRAARAVRLAAVSGSHSPFDFTSTVPALIERLASDNQELQIACADALALLNAPAGQQAIAEVALTEANAPELRMAAFNALAESARRWGNKLEAAQVTRVVSAAKETADLTMRTSASEALGALNLQQNEASAIIRSYHRG